MNSAQLEAISRIKQLPEEKIGEILDFLDFLFLKKEQEELLLSEDEENEIIQVIKNDDWVSDKELKKKVNALSV